MHRTQILQDIDSLSLFNAVPAIILMLNKKGRILYFNAFMETLSGYALDEVRGKDWFETFLPDGERKRIQTLFTGAIGGAPVDGNINAILTKSGDERLIRWHAQLLTAGDDEEDYLLSTGTDITELKHEHELSQSSERRFRQLFENMPEAFAAHEIICDDDGKPVDYRFIEVNPAFENLTGIAANGLIGKTVLEVLPGTESHWIDSYGKVALTGEPVSFQNYAQELDRHYDVRAYSPRHGQFATIFNDITKLKWIEHELAYNEEKYRKLVEHSPGIIYEYSVQHGGRYYSPQASEILGYPLKQLYDDPFLWNHAIHPDDMPNISEMLQHLEIGTGFDLEYRIRDAKGRWIWLNDRSIGIRQEDGDIIVTGLAMDVTERKQTEVALAHANRALVTLGTVNRELVHATDEGNLLQAICTAIVEQRGYRMAWVGYARANAGKDIELMASAGISKVQLDTIRPGWGDDARAEGPTGRAIRTGQTQVSRSIASEPQHDWQEAMLSAGCASSIALPLKDESGAAFGLLHVYAEEVDAFTDDEVSLLEQMANDLAFGVNVLRVRLERDEALKLSEQHLAITRRNLEQTISSMSKTVEARDPYTAGHQLRVAELAVAIGRRMGLDEDTLLGIHLGATIHDIGKINVPAEILTKPSRLSDMELLLVRGHAQIGFEILKDIDFPWPVAEVAHQHHERIDGSGYPQGLKGDEICLEARIVAVADVMEAMGSHRPYRASLGHERAIAEISGNRGRFYDSAVVDACLGVFADGFRFD